jgi:LCP family protein required for cell wall assembly
MRTTLKRGIGRGATANGNGRAVLPPTVLAPVTRYRQPGRPRRTIWARVGRVFLWLLALVVLVALGIAGGAYLYYNQSVAAVEAHSHDVKVAQKHLDIPPPNQPTTALVIGYDKRMGREAAITGQRSDTMMLLRADPVTNTISMMSVPRDLRTEIHCPNRPTYVDRINAAYAECGSTGSLETMKALTGLPINYLITVNFHGFKQIVDKLGGVWMDVDRRYFNKNVGTAATDFSNIDLKPGYQKLNGQDALAYVRYRHTDSDLYRIARQQQFVKGMKQQISKNMSVWKLLKIVGAIERNVEIGHAAGSGSLGRAIKSYALFAYGLPAGHFAQARIENLQNYDPAGAELVAPEQSIRDAVREFTHPNVEVPEKATRVALGLKAKKHAAPAADETSVSVLNGNGIVGSASNAAYALAQRGYKIVIPPTGKLRNAPSWDYLRTKVYYDHTQKGSALAARKLAALFGDGVVAQLPIDLVQAADGAMTTVVVGKTFHGDLAAAPVDNAPKKREPPWVRTDPSQSVSLLRSARKQVDFPLMVPTVVERASSIDREQPIRVYALKKHVRAVRLTFLTSSEASGYWGIEETRWGDAPVLQQPNVKHRIKGRTYEFYVNGPHVHMIVLRDHGATYWVVNTLLDALSNETMIAIAKGLQPLH